MRKSSLMVGAVAMVVSFGALANHCPVDMQQIDAALQNSATQLSAEQLAQVKKLRAEGEAAHKAGNHAQSMQKLGQAKQILGI